MCAVVSLLAWTYPRLVHVVTTTARSYVQLPCRSGNHCFPHVIYHHWRLLSSCPRCPEDSRALREVCMSSLGLSIPQSILLCMLTLWFSFLIAIYWNKKHRYRLWFAFLVLKELPTLSWHKDDSFVILLKLARKRNIVQSRGMITEVKGLLFGEATGHAVLLGSTKSTRNKTRKRNVCVYVSPIPTLCNL